MKACNRCLYTEEIPGISFDENGICNYCKIHDSMVQEYPTGNQGRKMLVNLANQIKHEGRKGKYDCVIGVSGGCDSSYMLHLANELGLRPLAAHYDNTWNNKIAVENIQTMLKALDIDLYTHVVDNEEMSDIYKSFLLASVPEIDAPTDIGLATVLYMAANKYNIKYIIDAHSFRTEGIGPAGIWYFDGKYIASVHKQFGTVPMKTYPNLWLSKWIPWLIFNPVKRPRPLYYVDYNKEEVKKMLHEKYGWQWYGGHHNENRWAIYCYNYYLQKKFNIDLRINEYSAFVRSGYITRDEAMKKLEEPLSFDPDILSEVKKRLNISNEEFQRIMNLPPKRAVDYPTYKPTFKMMRPFFWAMYKWGRVPKSFYIKYCF